MQEQDLGNTQYFKVEKGPELRVSRISLTVANVSVCSRLPIWSMALWSQ